MRTKSLAAPYIVWMVIFTVVPLAMVAYFAFTTSSGEFTLANMARRANYNAAGIYAELATRRHRPYKIQFE